MYKSIITFYVKSKAFDSLASFFESCAQVQIDEQRNYKAAVSTLEQAVRTLERANAGTVKDGMIVARVKTFNERLTTMQSFVKAQNLVDEMQHLTKGTPQMKAAMDEVIATCSNFIKRSRAGHADHDLIETALRIGDVFALLVKMYDMRIGDGRTAMKVLQSMSKHGVQAQYFVELEVIERLCGQNGKAVSDIVTGENAINGVSAADAGGSNGHRTSVDNKFTGDV